MKSSRALTQLQDSQGKARIVSASTQVDSENCTGQCCLPVGTAHRDSHKRIVERAKANQKAGGGSGISGRQNSAQPTKTRAELAKAAKVSHDTIAKAKQ